MDAPPHTYIVECYEAGVESDAVEAQGRRATDAAAALRREGTDVVYVSALVVPADEVVFHVFAASDAAAVRAASERAGIAFERVVESVSVGGRT